ncbi:MAG: response regulator [Verrucomicrobiota bacterium]|nr:response regulator [Verrucomicrobiota bacterium]
MTNKKSLTKVIFLAWLTTIIALSVLFLIFFIYYKYNDFEGTEKSLKRAHVKRSQKILKNNVLSLTNVINCILIDKNQKVSSTSEKITISKEVIDKLEQLNYLNSMTQIYIFSTKGKLLFQTKKNPSQKDIPVFIDEKGEDIWSKIEFFAHDPIGNVFSFQRLLKKTNKTEQIYGFSKFLKKLDIIIYSEISQERLGTAIILNVERLRINMILEATFMFSIFSLVVILTIAYFYRLSKTIKQELSQITNYLNDIHATDDNDMNLLDLGKFNYYEFESIGNSIAIMTKQIKGLLNKLKATTLKSEIANQTTSSLLTAVTHDFLVELNTIMGISQLMLKDNNSTQEEELEKIYISAESIYSIINNIETSLTLDNLQLQPENKKCNLHKLCGEVTRIIKMRTNAKQLSFNLHFEDSVPEYCFIDAIKIRQILMNLVENSFHTTNEYKDSITLQVKYDITKKVQNLIFIIEDTGMGFSGSELDEILSFPNARKELSVISLNIAVCKHLAKIMNGSLEIKSIKYEKTIYTLKLSSKATEKTKEELQQLKTGFFPSPSKKIIEKNMQFKVLTVEDDSANRDLLTRILEQKGYKTNCAVNGKDALEKIKSENYDLILMDCQMPILDGFEATKIIREEEKKSDKHIPIIAITGCNFPQNKAKCFKIGMDDFIPKPFNIKDLTETIKKHLAKNEKK